MNEWRGFKTGKWTEEIAVADFIQSNYTPYTGDESFLADATERTKGLNAKLEALFKAEREKGGVLDVDTEHVSSLLSYAPGYVDKDNEIIFGLQTDAPLKRTVNPFGGMRMAKQACEAYGYSLGERIKMNFEYKTTHNDGAEPSPTSLQTSSTQVTPAGKNGT